MAGCAHWACPRATSSSSAASQRGSGRLRGSWGLDGRRVIRLDDALQQYPTSPPPSPALSAATPGRLERAITGLDNGINFYRGNRDIFYLYIGIAYGLQIVDALVDAHLQDFDVSNDLSLHWQPQLLPMPGQPGALPINPGVLFALRVR